MGGPGSVRHELLRMAFGAEPLQSGNDWEREQKEKGLTEDCAGIFLFNGKEVPCNQNGKIRTYEDGSGVGLYCGNCWEMYQQNRKAIENKEEILPWDYFVMN